MMYKTVAAAVLALSGSCSAFIVPSFPSSGVSQGRSTTTTTNMVFNLGGKKVSTPEPVNKAATSLKKTASKATTQAKPAVNKAQTTVSKFATKATSQAKSTASKATTTAKQASSSPFSAAKKATSSATSSAKQATSAAKPAFRQATKSVQKAVPKQVQKAVPKPPSKPAIKKALSSTPKQFSNTKVYTSDFAGGLIGSDVEAKEFDPFGLSADRSEETLAWYRASELKHGRICMLAALGLLVQSYIQLPDDVFSSPKGLEALFQVASVRPQAIVQIVLAIAAVEVLSLAAGEGKAPGDYGWDPLNLRKTLNIDNQDKLNQYQLRELKNGRLAMVGTAGMLVQEALTKQGVVEQLASGHLNPVGDGQGLF